MQKKGMSIRLKLICIVIPIVLVLVISFFALARNMVLKTSQGELQAEAQVYTEEINNWTNQIFGELQVYLNTIESGNFENDDAILEFLETSVEKSDAYPVGLYMGDDSGVYLDGSGWIPGDDWVLVERDWYVDGKDNEKLAFGEPYYDSMTGQVCVSASVLVDYDKATRVLATDVYLDYVSEVVSNISNESEMDAFLVTKDSKTIIAHIDEKMMAVTLDTAGLDSLYNGVGDAVAAGKSGFVAVDGDDGTYYVCINPVENTGWYLVTYVPEKNVLADLHRMELLMLAIAVVAAIVLIIVILRMMNRVVKPVQKMTEVIDRIAEGDFSQNLESKGNDEIARMSNNMQSFIAQMRGTISEISDIAGLLGRQSVQNEELSDSLKDSSQSQANQMDMLEQMVEELSVAVDEASGQMEGLASIIEQTHMQGDAADVLMQESVIMSQNGKRDMEMIIEGMNNVNSSIMTLSDQMDRVGNIISQIGDMVGMIVDIAEETNLLSLNASIEAARAGEAGKGFSVVAEQIGKLAANSSVVTEEISGLTAEIQNTVNGAVEYMNASIDEVHNNVQMISAASATFENLYGKVAETSSRVQEMINLVTKVDEVSKQMEEIFGSQVHATEQIVQSAEELNQHTISVNKDSCTVAENAGELQKESMELMNRISRFRVE